MQTSPFLSFLIALLLRGLAFTWRLRLHDQAGLLVPGVSVGPVVWVLWHNRLLVIPIIYERLFSKRKGAVLISRSRDGAILADCIRRFGGEPVRGSSSRGGATALRALERKMADGYDAYITPDGPKGPRYSVGPGALWLAQAADVPLMPVSIESSRCWRLRSWDGFIIPKPFARVEVTLRALHRPAVSNQPAFETEREQLRELLLSGTKLP